MKLRMRPVKCPECKNNSFRYIRDNTEAMTTEYCCASCGYIWVRYFGPPKDAEEH